MRQSRNQIKQLEEKLKTEEAVKKALVKELVENEREDKEATVEIKKVGTRKERSQSLKQESQWRKRRIGRQKEKAMERQEERRANQ